MMEKGKYLVLNLFNNMDSNTNYEKRVQDRGRLRYGSNVIMGDSVKIQFVGHDIDSPEFENIRRKPGLVIEDYFTDWR